METRVLSTSSIHSIYKIKSATYPVTRHWKHVSVGDRTEVSRGPGATDRNVDEDQSARLIDDLTAAARGTACEKRTQSAPL